MSEPTHRSRLKAERRMQLLRSAAMLFADRGFNAVSIEDLGSAVGISGPAVYRHFESKEAILSELLVGVSQRLLEGGRAEVSAGGTPQDALAGLIRFHTDFALGDSELIRVQDRDFSNLPIAAAKSVRRLQRAYVEIWVEELGRLDGALDASTARTMAHAVFGLLNSTPHSAVGRDAEVTRAILQQMAMAALAST